VSDSHLYFALREVRRLYSSRKVLTAILGIALILGISGPFGTSSFMRTGPLIVYWIIIAYSTFAAGTFVAALSANYGRARKLSQWTAIALTSIGTGIAAIVIVVLVNWVALGLPPTTPGYFGTLTLTTFITAAIIALILYFTEVTPTDANPPKRNDAPLLARLPLEKRGPLVSVSVSDHYVEVTTTKGRDLILMRLSDAILECEGAAGMQVHRSHWIALDQVSSAKRVGDRAILTMSDGREIPVSRSYISAIKDAGLLPKSSYG
jgi:hypothetical protein